MDKKITKEMLARYLEKGAVDCPACGSGNIKGGHLRLDGTNIRQAVRCHDCGASWDDEYTLTDAFTDTASAELGEEA